MGFYFASEHTTCGRNVFGTAGFMRKRGVNLPRNLGLKTGVFLSVDGTLIAVFAVKYMPAENVDWALHALHHSRITPVLAVRDGNITPALLKRKFGTDARAVYPKLSTRLALSERGGGRPYALLMREGLMPYAEVVLGSKRLCASARRCTVLAFLAATASTLLAFYLTFVGAYSVLTPFSLLIFDPLRPGHPSPGNITSKASLYLNLSAATEFQPYVHRLRVFASP